MVFPKQSKYFACIVIILLYFAYPLLSQTDTVFIKYSQAPIGLDSLFKNDKPIVCTLKTDLKKFQKEKYDEKYQKAKFIYSSQDQIYSKNIKIRSRGVVRKKLCATPPIKIKFEKKSDNDTIINHARKIKLVTHCNSGANYTDYLLKEYLTYKIYGLITPYSFNVRLLRITYIDTGRKDKEYTNWAFIIEPIEMVAKRMDCVPIDFNSLGMHYTDSAATDLLSLWAFMVGNTDWSIPGRHNVKLLKHTDFQKPYPIPIPYDFDYCGLVNAHYSVPNDGLGLNSVRERLFTGPCRETEDYYVAANKILSKREEIENLIRDFAYLEDREKQDMIKYINTFYNLIEKPNYIKYHIETDCRLPGAEDE